MEFLLGWTIFCTIVALVAWWRGRNGFGWFVLAFIITPLLALILLAAMPARGRVRK